MTIKSSSPEYTGIRYEAFTLDLSAYAGARVTRNIDQVEFWTTDGWQSVRGVRHIYRPNREHKEPKKVVPPSPDNLFAFIDQLDDAADVDK